MRVFLLLLSLLVSQYIPMGGHAPSGAANPPALFALPMNEGSGLVFNDTSGHANNATLNNAVTWQANAGLPGITPLFNGTQTATSTSTTLLNFPATQAFTVGFCTNVNSSATGSTFISTLTNSAPYTGWEADTIGGAGGSTFTFFLINNYPSNAIAVSAPRPDGNLKYIVITYSGAFNGTRYPASDVAVYYNGIAQTLTVNADTLTGDPRSGLPALIGARAGSGGALLNGAMGYLEVWPYAQSASTVASAGSSCSIH